MTTKAYVVRYDHHRSSDFVPNLGLPKINIQRVCLRPTNGHSFIVPNDSEEIGKFLVAMGDNCEFEVTVFMKVLGAPVHSDYLPGNYRQEQLFGRNPEGKELFLGEGTRLRSA